MRVRFESFELDCGTGELFRDGVRLKLQDQPSRLLLLLVSRAGTLVTRDEIQSALWEDGQFVEFEHAINVAVKKIREALDDDPVKPRLIETLPRKGYRFIATIDQDEEKAGSLPPTVVTEETLERDFALPAAPARVMFLIVQALYLIVYCLTLSHMYDVASLLGRVGVNWLAMPLLIGAAGSIPVRLYLIFTVGLWHPAAAMKYRRMLPYLMPWDWLWAASPFLAAPTIGSEWALVLTAVLVYPPISQVILMRSIDHHRIRGVSGQAEHHREST